MQLYQNIAIVALVICFCFSESRAHPFWKSSRPVSGYFEMTNGKETTNSVKDNFKVTKSADIEYLTTERDTVTAVQHRKLQSVVDETGQKWLRLKSSSKGDPYFYVTMKDTQGRHFVFRSHGRRNIVNKATIIHADGSKSILRSEELLKKLPTVLDMSKIHDYLNEKIATHGEIKSAANQSDKKKWELNSSKMSLDVLNSKHIQYYPAGQREIEYQNLRKPSDNEKLLNTFESAVKQVQK